MVSIIASTKSDLHKLKAILNRAKNIVVLTGAGVSAESGVATYRGPGAIKRTNRPPDFGSFEAFKRNPSVVWEFYHNRREYILTKHPNKAHQALAETEAHLKSVGRSLTVITQNIDGLHQRAGSKKVIELHGSLYKTECLKCQSVDVNTDSPICSALQGRESINVDETKEDIPVDELPRCKNNGCQGLLRPLVVWFGEKLPKEAVNRAEIEMEKCDACLVVGTSSVVYPAAKYGPSLARRGIPVAEFNIEPTKVTRHFQFFFGGPCTTTLPEVLKDIHVPVLKIRILHQDVRSKNSITTTDLFIQRFAL